jgi:hypothetical protein
MNLAFYYSKKIKKLLTNIKIDIIMLYKKYPLFGKKRGGGDELSTLKTIWHSVLEYNHLRQFL